MLRHIWFKKSAPDGDHKARLEAFYAGQARQYDAFREHFLWGRRHLLAALAARVTPAGLPPPRGLVWVDLGGGTGQNVLTMLGGRQADGAPHPRPGYLDVASFEKIYVVDLCGALCAQARGKVEANPAWRGVVEVVEADACTFVPPGGRRADLVSFSYSLSMIPPFHAAVDAANTYLRDGGVLGVSDFYVSAKHDLPLRQHPWWRRHLWRATFDVDGIDLGPERRAYLDHHLHRLAEWNGAGSIPYVPVLRAPYYVWLGRRKTKAEVLGSEVEERAEAPPLFPPTFLYSQSWEDPRPDLEVLGTARGPGADPASPMLGDDVLTLTSGGCNSLSYALHGARRVVSVDCNPAQSSLLELKCVGVKHLAYEDFWLLFGEGRHPDFDRLYETRLAPFLSQTGKAFWDARKGYFSPSRGLYHQGGMGALVWIFAWLKWGLGLRGAVDRFCHAESLEEQVAEYEAAWPVRLLTKSPRWMVKLLEFFISLVFLNRLVMWYGGGVPKEQLACIERDGVSLPAYVARTFHGAATRSLMRTDNYFYYNCLMGRFTKECCPEYLKPEAFARLRQVDPRTGRPRIDAVRVASNFFVAELRKRVFTKVVFMDHADWLPSAPQQELCRALADQVAVGGRIIWRSASHRPPYAAVLEKMGFEVRRVQSFDDPDTVEAGCYMDRVNMYASFWCGERGPGGPAWPAGDDEPAGTSRPSTPPGGWGSGSPQGAGGGGDAVGGLPTSLDTSRTQQGAGWMGTQETPMLGRTMTDARLARRGGGRASGGESPIAAVEANGGVVDGGGGQSPASGGGHATLADAAAAAAAAGRATPPLERSSPGGATAPNDATGTTVATVVGGDGDDAAIGRGGARKRAGKGQ